MQTTEKEIEAVPKDVLLKCMFIKSKPQANKKVDRSPSKPSEIDELDFNDVSFGI